MFFQELKNVVSEFKINEYMYGKKGKERKGKRMKVKVK